MRPAVVLVLADGPSPVDPHAGRRMYEGGYLSRLLWAEGAYPVALSEAPASWELGRDGAYEFASRFDLVACGSQPRTVTEKSIIAEAPNVCHGSDNLEAWLRDRRAK